MVKRVADGKIGSGVKSVISVGTIDDLLRLVDERKVVEKDVVCVVGRLVLVVDHLNIVCSVGAKFPPFVSSGIVLEGLSGVAKIALKFPRSAILSFVGQSDVDVRGEAKLVSIIESFEAKVVDSDVVKITGSLDFWQGVPQLMVSLVVPEPAALPKEEKDKKVEEVLEEKKGDVPKDEKDEKAEEVLKEKKGEVPKDEKDEKEVLKEKKVEVVESTGEPIKKRTKK